ncbi:MAG: flagellar export chaperone FliS [Burkholderiaceae bacterium]|nr:flagellar export chaperone FliS [Burkholderiaceae bacterium]MEB2352467.1 flagellar export chaperone FliS [Burkholderiaceae bacterium]
MFSSHRPDASAYRRLDLETSVAQADPHALVGLLYDGALAAIAQARGAHRSDDIAARGQATTRALRILEEGLKASLDRRGGEIASNLEALYDYMIRQLLGANAAGDDARYAEVAAMLGQLRGAWNAIPRPARAAAVVV